MRKVNGKIKFDNGKINQSHLEKTSKRVGYVINHGGYTCEDCHERHETDNVKITFTNTSFVRLEHICKTNIIKSWAKPCVSEKVDPETLDFDNCNTVIVKVLANDTLFKIFFKRDDKVLSPKGSDVILDFIFTRKKHDVCDHSFVNEMICRKQLKIHNMRIHRRKHRMMKEMVKRGVDNVEHLQIVNREVQFVSQHADKKVAQTSSKIESSNNVSQLAQYLIYGQFTLQNEVAELHSKIEGFTCKMDQEEHHHTELGRKIQSTSKTLDRIKGRQEM